MRRRMIIGLCGPAGSGKSYAADVLRAEHGFTSVAFAHPIKRMIAALGVPMDMLYGSREVKERPTAMFGGKSLREVMQTLGTDWGRVMIDPDLWINFWLGTIEKTRGDIAADDVRFPEEAEVIRELGGIIIRVERSGSGSIVAPGHVSERQTIVPDHVVPNDSGWTELAWRLAVIIGDTKLQRMKEEDQRQKTPSRLMNLA